MLADELAEAVPNLGATAVAVRVLWRKLLARVWNGPDLIDRADADTVGLAQGAIDRSGLGHAHLCTADQGRDIGGICITVTSKSFTDGRFEYCRLECPPRHKRLRELWNRLDMDSGASISSRQSQQASVGHIPRPIQQNQISR